MSIATFDHAELTADYLTLHWSSNNAIDEDDWDNDTATYTWQLQCPDSINSIPESWLIVETIVGVDAWSHKFLKKCDNPDYLAQLQGVIIEFFERCPGLPVINGELDVEQAWTWILQNSPNKIMIKHDFDVNRAESQLRLTERLLRRAARGRLFRQGQGTEAVYVEINDGQVLPLKTMNLLSRTLMRFIDFSILNKKGGGYPSAKDVGYLFATPDQLIPELVGVPRAPFLRHDLTICNQEGYDPTTKLYYLPGCPGLDQLVPLHPTQEQIESAREIVHGLFSTFPWVHGKCVAIASLFEQLVLPHLKSRPLYLFDAPTGGQGSGKSLVPKLCSLIISGVTAEAQVLPARQEEAEKALFASLMRMPQFLLIDNVTDQVAGDFLAAVLTSDRVRGRILGQSSVISVPNRTTWYLSANGARTDRDLARRVVMCKLDSQKTPQKYPDLERVYALQRPQILAALLTLVRAWALAGLPEDPRVKLRSFERWARIIGGLVHFAGFDDLPYALNTQDLDEETTSLARLITLCNEIHGDNWIESTRIAEIYRNADLQFDRVYSQTEDGIRKAVARYIGKYDGRDYAGFRIERERSGHRVSRFRFYRSGASPKPAGANTVDTQVTESVEQ